jgi:spore coat-associated protein N
MTAPAIASRRNRRVLVPLATLLAAAGIAVASGATFSTSTASTGLVASGTLKQVNSNSVAFSKENLKPGDVVKGSVTITNDGSLPGTFEIVESQQLNTFAPAGDVTLVIVEKKEVAGSPVSTTITSASTTLGTMGTKQLGTYAAGESRTYDYTVTFSSAAANTQQGKRAETRYAFNSVQTAAETFEGTQGGSETRDPVTAP